MAGETCWCDNPQAAQQAKPGWGPSPATSAYGVQRYVQRCREQGLQPDLSAVCKQLQQLQQSGMVAAHAGAWGLWGLAQLLTPEAWCCRGSSSHVQGRRVCARRARWCAPVVVWRPHRVYSSRSQGDRTWSSTPGGGLHATTGAQRPAPLRTDTRRLVLSIAR